MLPTLVDAFNALPNPLRIPDDEPVPNEWHFDLRFWRRVPISTLCVVIVQPKYGFTNVELLPVDRDPSLDFNATCLKFFPDTYEEAAPDIVKLLLWFFVVKLAGLGFTDPPIAPRRFMTNDKALADAVGAELRRRGVRTRQLCDVQISSAEVNKFVDVRLKAFLGPTWSKEDKPIRQCDDVYLPKTVSLLRSAPDPPVPGGYDKLAGPARYAVMARHYAAVLARGTPPDGGPYYGPKSLVREHEQLVEIQQLLMDEPLYLVKSAADLGDSKSALDYGIRLSLGLNCARNRKLSRVYLMKAADSRTASAKTKATANGILVFWHLEASFVQQLPVHFLYAACHHANLAVRFCQEESNDFSSPAALWLLDIVISDDFTTPADMLGMYHDLFELDKERILKKRALDRAVLVDMSLRPHRYFCAAAGCDIVVDFAKALSTCAGKCDRDKKPRYCSWQCQKADWAAHKPFCRPGARCSVIEDPSLRYPKFCDPKAPFISKTLPHLVDGGVPILRSSTLTAAQLGALAPLTENHRRLKFPDKYASPSRKGKGNATAAPLPTSSKLETVAHQLSSCQASPQSNSSGSTLDYSDLDYLSDESDGNFSAMLETMCRSNIPWSLYRSMLDVNN